ncbi:MAG: hypothetical protein KC636_10655 [Myxococcales bacterium]|nr:hypothetical protein [Myxococcales bacterium]
MAVRDAVAPRWALLLSLLACAPATTQDSDTDAAHVGVVVDVDAPDITVDDEFGTDVRVFVHLDHRGGPDAESFAVTAASLALDLAPVADLELAIPADHDPFAGLADGESVDLELRAHLDQTHETLGVCLDPDKVSSDEARFSVNLTLRISPGANDDADAHTFEALAVVLHCSYTG